MRHLADRARCSLCAGLLQKKHPGVAVSIKTQQAARRCLNNLRDRIDNMRSEGVIDDTESHTLTVVSATLLSALIYNAAVRLQLPLSSVLRLLTNGLYRLSYNLSLQPSGVIDYTL